MWVFESGHGSDGCDLASTLCRYDIRVVVLFATTRSVIKSVKVPVVDLAKRAN